MGGILGTSASIAQTHARPAPGLVALDEAFPSLRVELRYATPANITGRPIYPAGRAWLRPETVQGLKTVQQKLRKHGLQLVILDAYRPAWAQEPLWKAFPNADFVAPPRALSRHSRGTTVDVTLADLRGGSVPVPSGFDEFTKAADHDFSDLSPASRRNATALRDAMFSSGFSGVPAEWWHYDLRDWKRYGVLQMRKPEGF
jgi:beta-N-acetylhexosaminidase/D-alanyl-D-alanine dipeptidase